ncbi:MAG: TraR/DksA family transcriptional regulator [Planctomycetota bacterium]
MTSKSSNRRESKSQSSRTRRGPEAESQLTARDIKGLRERLLEKRRELLAHITDISSAVSRSMEGNRENFEPPEQAIDTEHIELNAGLYSNQRAELREVEEALARMDEGTYGICLATGKPISLSRLRARPWAKYCIDYARQLERSRSAAR